MIEDISKKITRSLVEAGAVPPDDKALYEYGIRMGLLMAINVATALLIGLLLGMVLQCILFFIAYSPVRSYSGGYHARSSITCYVLSIPMILAVLLGIMMVPWNGYIVMTVLLIAVVVIMFLAPVADPNKPLNEREIIVYRRKARILSGVFLCTAIISWFAGLEQISESIAMALVMAAALLTLGIIVNGNIQEEKA